MSKRELIVGAACALVILALVVGAFALGRHAAAVGRYQAVVMGSPITGDMVARLDTQTGQIVACSPTPAGKVDDIWFYCVDEAEQTARSVRELDKFMKERGSQKP